jgi:hypothetical protein
LRRFAAAVLRSFCLALALRVVQAIMAAGGLLWSKVARACHGMELAIKPLCDI